MHVDSIRQDVLAHVDTTLAQKGSMVIAVAEGAGQEHVTTGEKDTSKNCLKFRNWVAFGGKKV